MSDSVSWAEMFDAVYLSLQILVRCSSPHDRASTYASVTTHNSSAETTCVTLPAPDVFQLIPEDPHKLEKNHGRHEPTRRPSRHHPSR